MKTDEELKEIAQGILSGQIFTDRHIEDDDMFASIFMPVAMFDQKQLKELSDSQPGLFYEYMSKAGPRAINGYPSFFSYNILSIDETKKMIDYMGKIQEAIKKI
ncbi:MAG: hypothetical protein A2V66_01820 [Ignavibacteria bacterium RBG_13_36_8]|nr:MAG: hypothetical protein A2V66_01820 [Ignavibacteria bacterium RBG_13_36_8]